MRIELERRADGGRGGAGPLWWWMLVRGSLAIALGLVALLWPQWTLAVMFRVLGIFCVLDGAVGLLGAHRAGRGLVWPAAWISLVIGTVLLFWPDASAHTLMFILGVFVLLQGVQLFRAGRRMGAGGALTTMGGAVAVVGVVLMLWPQVGAIAVSWLIAGLALAAGATMLWFASRLKATVDRG